MQTLRGAAAQTVGCGLTRVLRVSELRLPSDHAPARRHGSEWMGARRAERARERARRRRARRRPWHGVWVGDVTRMSHGRATSAQQTQQMRPVK